MSNYLLHKNRGSSISSETSKYYIKCDAIATANRIKIVKLLQKQRDEDSRVLLAYLEKNDSKMNIVVKMARENTTIRKEYFISENEWNLLYYAFQKIWYMVQIIYNRNKQKMLTFLLFHSRNCVINFQGYDFELLHKSLHNSHTFYARRR